MNLTIDLALKEALKPELTRLNAELEALARQSDSFLGDLLSYVLSGSGKRVRPALVMLGASLGKSPIEHVRVVEMSVELIHIATLVHDDVIDKAAMRRNQKTVAFEHGVDTAVLLGDHIYTRAFQKVAELGHPRILELLAKSTSVMCEGEINQLKNRYQFDLSEDAYFSFIQKKTASLFGVSVRSGAILAQQSEAIQLALEKFGIHLGVAFQITDDLLDLTGNEGVVGKTLHTDLMNGKMTLPLIHYRDHLESPHKKAALVNLLKNPQDDFSDLIQDLKAAGSLSYTEDLAQQHISQALSELEILPASKTKDLFVSLVDMLKRRDS